MRYRDEASMLAHGRVPAEPFRSVFIALAERQNYDTTAGEADGKRSVRDLAARADLDPRRVYELLEAKYDSYSFDFCDKLLCELDGPLAWNCPELYGTYQRLNLVKLDTDDAVLEAMYEGKSWEQL